MTDLLVLDMLCLDLVCRFLFSPCAFGIILLQKFAEANKRFLQLQVFSFETLFSSLKNFFLLDTLASASRPRVADRSVATLLANSCFCASRASCTSNICLLFSSSRVAGQTLSNTNVLGCNLHIEWLDPLWYHPCLLLLLNSAQKCTIVHVATTNSTLLCKRSIYVRC